MKITIEAEHEHEREAIKEPIVFKGVHYFAGALVDLDGLKPLLPLTPITIGLGLLKFAEEEYRLWLSRHVTPHGGPQQPPASQPDGAATLPLTDST